MKPKGRGKWEKQRKPLEKQKKAAERRVEKTSWLPPRWLRAPSGRWEAPCAPRSLPAPCSLLSAPRPPELHAPAATLRQKPLQRTNYLLVSEMGPRGGRQIACLVHNKPGVERRTEAPRLPAGRGGPAVPTGPAAPPAPTARGACSP